jgi:undecaprenyl-diphosphatase
MLSSELIEAVVLGVVQGIAEFLPISSKGHLVILQEPLERWLDIEASGERRLGLTVVLHLGTLFSILVVYRADLRRLLRDWRGCLQIVLATVPVVIVGFTFKDRIEEYFETPLLAGCGLLVTAVLLVLGQKLERNQTPLAEMSFAQALVVGLFQAAALAPGISRSGTTIAGGLLAGLRRDAAATFSFLIAIPAIVGANVLVAADAWAESTDWPSQSTIIAWSAGVLTSFVVGLLALMWLLRVVSHGKLHWFAVYCAVAGVATICWQMAARQ